MTLLLRRADLTPTSINPKARTVRATISTGAPVCRTGLDGPFIEKLDLAGIDPAALIGKPVLDAHRQGSVADVIGVVIAAGKDAAGLWADLQISQRSEAVWQDIAAGILRGISIGYLVNKWSDSISPDSTRTMTAEDFTIHEISFVPVPSDPAATVRSQVGDIMNTAEQAAAPALDTRAQINQEIRSIGAQAGLDQAWIDQQIDAAVSPEQARAAAFEALVTRSGPTIQTTRVDVGFSHDAPAVRLERMTEALHCRLMPTTAPSEAARQYMNRSLVDMAAELLQARGKHVTFLSRDQILQRAMHTTSDFSNLLTGTGNRVLLATYEAAPSPLKTLARQATVPDFRTKTTLKLSEAAKLTKVNEGGEVTYGSRAEAKEAYSISTFAKIFSISRTALINDDLGAFADWSVAMGKAAAETENSELVSLLTANSGAGPTLDDGAALFHSSHGNLAGSGGAISATTLSAGRKALRDQKGLDGVTPVNAMAKYLLVSSTKETEAEQVLATLYPATVGNVNPFSGRLDLLVEPRLSGNRWYLFADPALLPVLEYSYLTGAPGPQMSSREGWDSLGMEFRVVLDFGCGAIEHRGAYSDPGA